MVWFSHTWKLLCEYCFFFPGAVTVLVDTAVYSLLLLYNGLSGLKQHNLVAQFCRSGMGPT